MKILEMVTLIFGTGATGIIAYYAWFRPKTVRHWLEIYAHICHENTAYFPPTPAHRHNLLWPFAGSMDPKTLSAFLTKSKAPKPNEGEI